MPPALRARSAALLVLLAEAADPVEVAEEELAESPVAAASVVVPASAEVVVVAGALKALEVELGNWLAYWQKICFWPW